VNWEIEEGTIAMLESFQDGSLPPEDLSRLLIVSSSRIHLFLQMSFLSSFLSHVDNDDHHFYHDCTSHRNSLFSLAISHVVHLLSSNRLFVWLSLLHLSSSFLLLVHVYDSLSLFSLPLSSLHLVGLPVPPLRMLIIHHHHLALVESRQPYAVSLLSLYLLC
jgi:hypothetical protein